MSVKEFADKARKAVQDVLGDEYFVDTGENLKLNETRLWSINIHSKSRNITPVIFLDSFYQEYEEGKSFGEIINSIINIYWEHIPKSDIDLSYITEYEKVKDKICLRLCNLERNNELLKDSVYIPFLDLAILFYINFEQCDMGKGMIRVRSEYLEKWDVTTEKLMKDAMENSKKDVELKVLQFWGYPMYVMSNKSLSGGASSMLYPEALEEFANKNEANIFVIPSSIHEVILIPDKENDEQGSEEWIRKTSELRNIICMVNREEVSADEVLSDNLYYFDRSQKKIKIV